MARTLIGTGTTDSNGRVSVTYTGTGAGKLQIVAESGTVTSDTYDLWDALFYDSGLSDHRTDWTANTISESYLDDGTVITESNGSNTNYAANFTAIVDVVIEVDITGITIPSNSVRFYYKGADTTISSYLTDLQPHHFKFVCQNGTVVTYVDDVQKNSKSTTTNTTCRFIMNGSSFKFSDFKIYAI